jgi:hypothetical protein
MKNETASKRSAIDESPRTLPFWNVRRIPVLTTAAVVAVLVLLLVPAGSAAQFASTSAPRTAPAVISHVPGSTLAALTHQPARFPLLTQPRLTEPTLRQLPAMADLRAVPTAPAGAAPRPDGSSTASNWYVNNYSAEADIASIGGSSSNLIAAGASLYDLLSGPGGTIAGSFWKTGITAAYGSSNGGMTWSTHYVPGNVTHWQSSSDYGFGSVTWGDSAVASNATGGTILLSSLYLQPCLVLNVVCNSTVNITAPLGAFVTHSLDGGSTWSAATVLNMPRPYAWGHWVTGTTPCQGSLPANQTDKPWLAYNPFNHVAIAGWTLFSYGDWKVDCTTLTAVPQIFDIFVQVVRSTDDGKTWGAPTSLTYGGAGVQIAIGPGPTYPVYAGWEDLINATNFTSNYGFRVSTDNGTTWGTQQEVGTSALINPISSSYPDAFRASTIPWLWVDSGSTSAHKGTLYLTWNDNRTGPYSGYSTIAFTESTNGGASWSAATYVAPSNTGTPKYTYFQPSIATDPNGTVWMIYYGENQSTGNYRLYGLVSLNGGTSWSSQFPISDTDSLPGSLGFIGDYTSLVATSSGAFPMWTDCRLASCSTSGNTEFLASEIMLVPLLTNGTGISATVTQFGVRSSFSLPALLPWEVNATSSVTVPSSAPLNATFFQRFAGWSGLSTSLNYQVSVVYPGAGFLSAGYIPVPASYIAGTVQPSNAVVTLNGAVVTTSGVNLTTSAYNVTVASGNTYWLNATAAKYTPYSNQVGTTPRQVTTVNIVLQKIPGWIAGSLSPATATLTINGTAVTVGSTGLFNVSKPWGAFWVNASETGLTNYSQYVSVNPSRTTPQTISLVGGWIAGSITPPSSGASSPVLTVDGIAVNVSFGTYNASVKGGLHTLVVSLAGYANATKYVSVTPGRTNITDITLSNLGWITGTIIGNSTALHAGILKVGTGGANSGGAQPFNRSSGAFNVSEVGGRNYTVTVTGTGYNISYKTVLVIAGEVTPVTLYLNASTPPPCTQNCNPGGPGGSTGSNLYLYAGIGVAVAAAAIAAALLLMRRGRKGPQATAEQPQQPEPDLSEQTYQGTAADIPTLQEDGSLQGPAPPPG